MANHRHHRSFVDLMNLWNRMVFPHATFEIVPDSQTPSTDGAFGAENLDPWFTNPDVADVLRQLSLSDGRMDHFLANLKYENEDMYRTPNDANLAEPSSDWAPTEAAISTHSAHITSESAMTTLPSNDIIAIPPTAVAITLESSNPPAPKKATCTCSSARHITQAQASTTPTNSEVWSTSYLLGSDTKYCWHVWVAHDMSVDLLHIHTI